MIGAGSLRHRATFRRLGTQAADEWGNESTSFVDHLTVWANVRETTGKERVAAGSVENVRTATMRVRSSADSRGITEADRVVARGETWNILGISNADDQGAMLDMLLQAGGIE